MSRLNQQILDSIESYRDRISQSSGLNNKIENNAISQFITPISKLRDDMIEQNDVGGLQKLCASLALIDGLIEDKPPSNDRRFRELKENLDSLAPTLWEKFMAFAYHVLSFSFYTKPMDLNNDKSQLASRNPFPSYSPTFFGDKGNSQDVKQSQSSLLNNLENEESDLGLLERIERDDENLQEEDEELMKDWAKGAINISYRNN